MFIKKTPSLFLSPETAPTTFKFENKKGKILTQSENVVLPCLPPFARTHRNRPETAHTRRNHI